MNISVLQFWIMIVDSKLILMVEFYNILWFSLSDLRTKMSQQEELQHQMLSEIVTKLLNADPI